MKRFKVSRKVRSWACANIILDKGLFDDWKIFCYNHPKIKSKYRSANLFLSHRKLLYHIVDIPISGLNMDNLEDYYFDKKAEGIIRA